MLVASAALYALEPIRDLRHSNPGCCARGTRHDGVEDTRSLGNVRLRLPSKRRSWAGRQRDCLGGGSDLTLALRVGTKLGTLLIAESILFPRVHDELGDSQQTLQGGCCRVGRILLEGLLETLTSGAIILVGVMEVGEHRHELTEKCCVVLDRNLAIVGQGRNQLFGELLADQCDVVLVDRDGFPHRLVQLVPLIVSADEVVRHRERVALLEGLNDEGDFPFRLPVCDRPIAMMD